MTQEQTADMERVPETIPVAIHQEDQRGNVFKLLEAITVYWENRTVFIPAGFESDGVSTPRFLWSSISPAISPETLRAGIAHDFIYRMQPKDWTRADADKMFRDLCIEDGLKKWRALKAYWGLRLFGGTAWKENAAKKMQDEENGND